MFCISLDSVSAARIGCLQSVSAMRPNRSGESGLTLYQLLVGLVVLVIVVSLGLAAHHRSRPEPFFADLERLNQE